MRRVSRLSVLVFLPVLAQAGPSNPAVNALFKEALANQGPGCSVSVMRGDRVELSRAWGSANLEQPRPNRLDTVYEAGSVSKQFTAAAVAVLITQGKLMLDDDVGDFIPELPDYGAPITVRQLLTHTSGVRNWDDIALLSGRPRDAGGGITQADALAYIVRQSAINFPPGTQYLYSNSNYVLAAVLVERISGQSLQAFSEHFLFAPAGMKHTQWRDDYTRVVPHRATAYTPNENGELHLDMPIENVVGPGGLLTTVEDLQRWNAFLLRPPSRERPWVNILTSTRGRLTDGTAIHYGLGLEYDTLEQQEVVSHAGATAGYRAYLGQVPAQSLSVAILCNAGALNSEELGPKILSAYLSAPPTPGRPAIVTPALGISAPADLAGRYWNAVTRAVVTVTVDTLGARLNGGAEFHAVSPEKLVTADGKRTLTLRRTVGGGIDALTVQRSGNSSVTLHPAAPWLPTNSDLATFVGQYRSADADGVWSITMNDSALKAQGPGGASFLLSPVYRNTFTSGDAGWTLAFDTNSAGEVAGVRFFRTRTLDVYFRRLPREPK